jgi:16S rRNA processing protein RimM
MLIGTVQGAFGLRGELKIKPHTDFPERFARLRQVFLGPQRAPYTVKRSRPHQDRVLLTLAGVETPERARDLTGLDLAVPRSEAVELPEGHYYLDDLVGLTVFSADGKAVGEVSDVLQTGSNDVLVVGRGNNAVLIPLIADAVVELNVEGRRAVVQSWVLEPAL